MTDTPEIKTESRISPLRLLKWTVGAALVIFVILVVAKNLRGFDWRHFHLNLGFAICAAISVALVNVIQMATYRLLLGAYGPKLSWAQAATLSWVPSLGKYIPGKVASIGGTVYLLRRYKIPAAIALSVALMGDAAAILTGLIVGAPMLAMPEVRAHLPGGWVWCVLLIVASLVCLYPPNFTKLVNIALRKMKRTPLSAHPRLGYYVVAFLVGSSQWIFWGSGNWFIARAITPVGLDQWPAFVVVAAMAASIGYLAFFSPGGVGFRELFTLLGLSPIIGPDKAAIVVVVLRLIQLIVEILSTIAGVMILRRTTSDDPKTTASTAPIPLSRYSGRGPG